MRLRSLRCWSAPLISGGRGGWGQQAQCAEHAAPNFATAPGSATPAGRLRHDAGEQPEFKQVTVLFADVVNSLAIASTLGAERLREIMADVFGCAATITRRYGGTVDKFTGDGIMALFGAPVALEDHAFRACLAALDIQEQIAQLADEVQRRDGVVLRLRVGLNSGRVIAGEISSDARAYTAVGEQVGLAQRMESVAPPGGVMLSESTARLVEHATVLGAPEWVHVKGAEEPLPARRLLGAAAERGRIGRREPTLVGRTWEMNTVAGILDQAISGAGCVVGVVGPPGIGKSRIMREAVTLATGRGVEVFTVACESHTREVPFHLVARLLRTVFGVSDLDEHAGRAQVRARIPDANPEDLLLLDDLLGIGDPDAAPPAITADARRRRLAALLNAVALARTTPAQYVIEDVHWIDEVSEAMLAEFVTVVPQSHSLGADHLPARIPGRVVADTGRPDDLPGAAQRGADRGVDHRAAGYRPVGACSGRADRRAGRREPVLRRGDGA